MATCTDCGDMVQQLLRERENLRGHLLDLYRERMSARDAMLGAASTPHEEEILRLREEVARCHDSLREADRVLRQAYAERDEARAEERRDVVDWLHNGADLADADGLIYGPYQDAIEMVADGIANGCHEGACAPDVAAPSDTSGVSSFFGTWPGDETDEELLAALRALEAK